jgi:hypothetical protein
VLQQYSTFKNRQGVVAVHLKQYGQTYVYLYENVQQVCNIHMLFGLCEPVICFDEMHLKCIKTCLNLFCQEQNTFVINFTLTTGNLERIVGNFSSNIKVISSSWTSAQLN